MDRNLARPHDGGEESSADYSSCAKEATVSSEKEKETLESSRAWECWDATLLT